MLGSYIPFTYFFAVTLHYNTEEDDFYYYPILYNWHFSKSLHISDMVVNTTSPLLNHTFEMADSYQYRLWVFNAVSTGYATGNVRGIAFLLWFTYADIVFFV